jgi:hypothetical protein
MTRARHIVEALLVADAIYRWAGPRTLVRRAIGWEAS